MDSQRTLEAVTIHEAAHAVAAILAGERVKSLEVFPCRSCGECGGYEGMTVSSRAAMVEAKSLPAIRAVAMVGPAGHAAHEVLLKREATPAETGSLADAVSLSEAFNYVSAKLPGFDAHAEFGRALDNVRRVLAHPPVWALVEKVAAACRLADGHALDEARLKVLLDPDDWRVREGREVARKVAEAAALD